MNTMKTEDEIIRERGQLEGAKGGKRTLEKYGKVHFVKLGKRSAKARKKLKANA